MPPKRKTNLAKRALVEEILLLEAVSRIEVAEGTRRLNDDKNGKKLIEVGVKRG